MAQGRPTLILCDLINPVNDRTALLVRSAGILIESGHIKRIYHHVSNGLQKEISKKGEVLDRTGLLAMPGFFDLHFHWVQEHVCLMPKDSLLTWLKNYTWPLEKKFSNLNFAKKEAAHFQEKLLRVGTLGGASYGSVHGHTVGLGLNKFLGHFVVGNVLMTMNSPSYLLQSEKEAQVLTETLAARYRKRYAVTPRFAPTVHPSTMMKVALMAKRYKTFVQTHLCETKEEVSYVLDLYRHFPEFRHIESYAEIYGRTGILGPRTIVGHGIYLSATDIKWLLKTKSIIAHCPTSNAPIREQGLGSGRFDLLQADQKGLRWALASDVGGGPYLSMFDVIHSFVRQQKTTGRANYTRGLYRATAAGAGFLGVGNQAGQLRSGYQANLIFVPTPKRRGGEEAEDVLRRVIDRKLVERESFNHLVAETWWQGKPVFSMLGAK
ncbi:MAG: amidohydrolase family protein [Bdellovibrio sp.]|nr:amidohydrolase family protein [Bdellovibrio sp.]